MNATPRSKINWPRLTFPGISGFIDDVLKAEKEDIVRVLWNSEIRLKTTGSARTLMDITCYTLTNFASNCKQPLHSTNNHERTPFVKNIVPMFKYFSQETNLIEFSWCEKSLETYGMASLETSDFATNSKGRIYADAFGKNTVTNNEDLIIEASSGFDKENVGHSLDDTLKLLAECSNALLHTIKQNKNASIESITKKCVFGVQIIKQTLTLTKMTLSKSGKWKLVEDLPVLELPGNCVRIGIFSSRCWLQYTTSYLNSANWMTRSLMKFVAWLSSPWCRLLTTS